MDVLPCFLPFFAVKHLTFAQIDFFRSVCHNGSMNGEITDVCLIAVTKNGGVRAWQELIRKWRCAGREYLEISDQSDISQARSAAASKWLSRNPSTWALWIDDDISVDWNDLNSFVANGIATEHHLICAQYVGRSPKSRVMSARLTSAQVTYGVGGGYYSILGCGFGLTLTKRVMFSRMSSVLPLVRYEVDGKIIVGRPYFAGLCAPAADDPDGPRLHLGEDYSFCWRARDVGSSLVCDTRTRVWHHGEYRYGLEDYDSELTRFSRIVGSFGEEDAVVSHSEPTDGSDKHLLSVVSGPKRDVYTYYSMSEEK